jgi:hypothetical protein
VRSHPNTLKFDRNDIASISNDEIYQLTTFTKLAVWQTGDLAKVVSW